MKITSYIFFLMILISSACRKTPEENPIDDTVQILETDVAYGNHPLQKMDVFIPAGNRDTMALLVLIHGGSWTGRDKSDLAQWFDYEVSRNRWAVININYRLDDYSTRPLPMQTDDIGASIEKLRSEFHFPARKIGMIGFSSGAHIASQFAYKYDHNRDVKALVNYVGPVDFNDPEYHTPGHWEWIFSGIEYIFNLPYDGNESQYAEWSPYHHADAQSPPTILFYGQQDTLVTYTNGLRLHQKLTQLGVENEFHLYPQSGHSLNPSDAWNAFSKTERFLESHLLN